MRKLPVGIQNFQVLRQGGYLYVDKTALLHRLVTEGKYYFLSRPRRFGKSLMVSTLVELFRGQQELFTGLWIDKQWDWTRQSPVIHLSLNSLGYKEIGLEKALTLRLNEIAAYYGLSLQSEANSLRPARVDTTATSFTRTGGSAH